MRLSEYPPQEPLSEAGAAYGAECWKRSKGIECDEIAYGADVYRRLAVFRPSRPDGRVLLFWHGGGWTSGYKEWMGFMAPSLMASGITFVSGGYRLAPQHNFPAGLEDCQRSLDWVSKEISDTVFIGGHSAGGHYAALIAASQGANLIRGCLPISGVYEFGDESGLTARPRFLNGTLEGERMASPRFQLRAPLPPFLVAFGSKDFSHLIQQAKRFVAAVRKTGGIVDELELAERTHFTASYAGGEPEGPWVPSALAFISKYADQADHSV